MSNLRSMRSAESKTKSPVKFINTTDKNIEIFWLNYSGEEISYGTLHAAPSVPSVMDINTFVTHPWIAVDSENRQRLWLNSEEVFHPPQPRLARVVIGPNREQIRAKRANIFITKPGGSWKHCFRMILGCIFCKELD